MKRTKRALLVLLAATMTAGMSTTAFAKKVKGNVPTEGTLFKCYKGSEFKEGSFKSTYTKDGKIKAYLYTEVSSGATLQRNYAWKNNLLTKVLETATNSEYTKTTLTTYTYKNKRISKAVVKEDIVYKTGKASESSITTTKYKWNGKEGTAKTVDSEGYRSANVLKVNNNNQKVSDWNGSSKYVYSNGILTGIKSYVIGTKHSDVNIAVFNSYGYPTSKSSSYTEPTGKNNWNRTTTFTYATQGTTPTNVVMADSMSHRGNHTYKVTYTAWQSVNQVRNCDAFGTQVFHAVPVIGDDLWLGVYDDEGDDVIVDTRYWANYIKKAYKECETAMGKSSAKSPSGLYYNKWAPSWDQMLAFDIYYDYFKDALKEQYSSQEITQLIDFVKSEYNLPSKTEIDYLDMRFKNAYVEYKMYVLKRSTPLVAPM